MKLTDYLHLPPRFIRNEAGYTSATSRAFMAFKENHMFYLYHVVA
jgi:hypothetical protein